MNLDGSVMVLNHAWSQTMSIIQRGQHYRSLLILAFIAW